MQCHANHTTRRELMAGAGAVLLGSMLGGSRIVLAHDEKPRKRVLRIAHLTDMHVQPELSGGDWVVKCLHHVQSQQQKPDVIFFGGDTIMDSFDEAEARPRELWGLWQRLIKGECGLPMEYCLGNHDIWGWNKKKSGTTGSEPLYGKKWALEVMGLERPYRSFDRAGWHFIVLDSTHTHNEDGYIARLDPEQMAWLESDLKKTPKDRPVGVLSHIPIASVAGMVWAEAQNDRSFRVSGSLIHSDQAEIRKLFAEHGNVRLALSGHLHLVDRCEYEGVTYLCNGAVSGSWWKGKHRDCNPGYALVDLYEDGTVDRHYVEYGWKPA
ncbi:MAG: metallophosphoesterase [Phycisphaerales bacterium]|nr:metallophosphoesterase [Phycisphaerales bacterium]